MRLCYIGVPLPFISSQGFKSLVGREFLGVEMIVKWYAFFVPQRQLNFLNIDLIMKKIILILAAMLTLASCTKEGDVIYQTDPADAPSAKPLFPDSEHDNSF